MTRTTRLLLWLLSMRSDVVLNIHIQEDPQPRSAVDYLEDCYELNPAFFRD